ncbi:MIP/aquaporin family protein [Nocardioides sp.]|uniref:MIP/aquaporin family protein n=1 Tax=Nocardioides sp. TaxID=35761 RepID=UPI002717211A|nr:aquaporin [Nocardioides sp.]MDO9457722.1 aquaporin [Nocardioides sp.]
MDTTTPAPPTSTQKLLAEAIGTFVLVVLGVGAAVFGGGDIAAIGLAFGIAIIAMVYSFGRISGGHFNPAVSVGAALGGRISWKEAGTYIGAQVVGGLVGGIVLLLIAIAGDTGYEFGDDALGANGFGDRGGVDLFGALIIELVLTFIFITVILSVTDERNEHPALAPLAIGLTLAAIHFASIGATGTSVNPARSISTVFFSGTDAIVQIWLFILAPIVGGALAGLAYPAIFGHASEPVAGSGLNFNAKAGAAVPGYGAPDQFQQQWNQPGGSAYGGQPDPGAYQQPGAYAAPAAQAAAAPQPQVEQPIIQDGWQWDPQAQQWIPAQQQAPQAPQQGGWPAPGGSGEQTQVRPNDGV